MMPPCVAVVAVAATATAAVGMMDPSFSSLLPCKRVEEAWQFFVGANADPRKTEIMGLVANDSTKMVLESVVLEGTTKETIMAMRPNNFFFAFDEN